MGSDHPIIPRNLVKFLPPITNPDKVICVGMNYKDHCEEQGAPIPVEPIIFNKFPSTITGPYDDIQYTEETMVSLFGLIYSLLDFKLVIYKIFILC